MRTAPHPTSLPSDPRYADMLAMRGVGCTMAAIGVHYGISRERVRQIIGNQGNLPPEDWTGRKRNWLTVIDGTTSPRITVRCKCGTVKQMARGSFRQAALHSCGCYQRQLIAKLCRKMTDADVRQLRRWRDAGWTFKALGAHFGIHHCYAWSVYNRWRGRRANA